MAELQNNPLNALDVDEINRLTGQPPQGVHEEIVSIVGEALSLLEDIFDVRVKRPEIVYDLKGRTAGYASRSNKVRNSDGTFEWQYAIRLNCDLLHGKHREEMLKQTVPHEAAHIFVYQKWPGAKGHGGEWALCMMHLGLEATRCHQYETTKARNRERMDRPYIYICDCPSSENLHEHHLTKIRHRRIQDEGKNYICRRCRGKLLYLGEESEWED